MTEQSPRTDGSHCFVCGPRNSAGLNVAFRLDGDICRAEYTPTPEYCGYDGVTHGGILFSLLDDVMANWLFLQGERAYTGRCEIRFRATAPIGEKLLLEGELLLRKGRTAKMAGRALHADSNTLVAETTATFRVVPD